MELITEQEQPNADSAGTPRSKALIAVLVAAGLAASLWVFGVAGAQNGSTVGDPGRAGEHITVLRSQGRFTGPGDWPPAPHEARTPHVRSTRPAGNERSQIVDLIETHHEVQVLLGADYSLVSSSHPPSGRPGAAKGERDQSQLETIWFSRSTNQTVIVISDAAGARTSNLRTVPASEMQPDLTDEEDAMAIALARTFWATEGDTRIDDLEGFSIWALREDGRVYDVRMAYVSFHSTREHKPELITWVDLTNQTVVRSEVLR